MRVLCPGLGLSCVLVISGCESCGPVANGGSDGGVLSTGGVPGFATESHPSASTSGASTLGSIGTDATTSTEAKTDSSSASTSAGLPDLPPFPEECWNPDPTVLVEWALGPSGPLTFDSVYLITDACTGGPVIHLGETNGENIVCILGDPQPLEGTLECAPFWGQAPELTAELLEPYDDPQWEVANAGVHLHARIVAQGEGWDVSVVVDVSDCGDWSCYCPCE